MRDMIYSERWKELFFSVMAGEGIIILLAVIGYDSFIWILPLQILLLPVHT